jgi:preprotein translocase subunit SecA
MITIESKFIGDFKIGDNINHNLKILEVMYKRYAEADDAEKRLLCKPIVVLLVSLIDAVFCDLHTRIKTFTREGVENIIASSIEYIRTRKKMDDLEKYIASAKKHGLIELLDHKLYDDLDELRKLRNRIHIQNTKNYPPRNEYDAFTSDKKLLAEKAVERTFRVMANKYARKLDYVDSFSLPWEPHFP